MRSNSAAVSFSNGAWWTKPALLTRSEQGPKARSHASNMRADGCLVADVGALRDRAPVAAIELGRGPGRRIHVDVGDDDGGAGFRQAPGNGAADAAGGAGDDGDMGGEIDHRISSWMATRFARLTLIVMRIA